MPKVFLSYNHRDRELAASIADGLKQRGFELVIDVDALAPGVDWRSELMTAIRQSDAVVALITENASPHVISEMGAARALGDTLLIPIVVGQVEIPSPIADINAILIPDATNSSVDLAIARIQEAFLAYQARLERKRREQLETEQREKEKAQQKLAVLDSESAEFLEKSFDALSKRENFHSWRAAVWSWIGFLALLIAVIYAASVGFQLGAATTPLPWCHYFLYALKTLVVVALVIAIAKYAVGFAKTHMNESLRNADRIHANSFGRFYLKAYGDVASREEIRDVFQHWNIDTASAFLQLDPDKFDPKVLDVLKYLAEGAKPAGSKDSKKGT